ncbi:MAG: MobF family relaxase [Opitutaceae bacterium]|nr:MobF family relaxase [Opitutaceae bacterium]
MIQPRIQFSLGNAKKYFREHLSVGDYYSQGAKVEGEWLGEGAWRLGLKGTVKEADFLALCEGKNPATGDKLGQRLNTVRWDAGKDGVPNRRIFYDFAIAPPKSVSVVALYQDDRIVDLHNEAVRQTMLELEKFAESRVRKSGQNGERVTGNIVTACFRHDTSRELDPHLHTHCVVFNATFDPVESRWKALHPAGMYRAQNFATNFYRHELCKGLRALGYEIESTSRGFEIKGVSQSVIARFSKRNQQINEEARQHLERGAPISNVGELRKRIAHGNRRRKLKDSTADRLRPSWAKQLTTDDAKALGVLRCVRPRRGERADVAGVVAWVDEHLFERRSVVNDYELMAAALARGRGQDFDLTTLREAIDKRGYLREDGTHKLTSREVLRCELDIVMAARDGRRRHAPLNAEYTPAAALSMEQQAAARQILGSRDFITLFRGGAGTGKSYALKEVERGLASAGHPVIVLAPQRQQVRDLQKDGLAAQTVSQLLVTMQLPPRAVVLVDEAGQIGGRQLHTLIRLVQACDGRMILSGDTRQHGAVAASDALRAIEEHAMLKPVEIRTIRRQNPALGQSAGERRFIRSYRAAVKAATQGAVLESFDRLDRLGCVREMAPAERRDALAGEYLAALARKESALVVAQTWSEVRAVNEAIRERLRAAGMLGEESKFKVYQAVDATEAQKQDARFHRPGHHVYFLRRYGRFAKGDLCEVAGTNKRGVVLMKDGRRSTLGYRHTDRLTVVTMSEMEIAAGDRLQLKFNGRSGEGAPLSNGELVTVRRGRKDGALIVEDDAGTRKTLLPSQRLFNRGYAVTSYASQGKTVDTVLFADAASWAATNCNQWYVAISRGRRRVVVFTSDKERLRANIERTGGRELALDLKVRATAMNSREQAVRQSWMERQAWASIERVRRFRFLQDHRAQVRQTQQARIKP